MRVRPGVWAAGMRLAFSNPSTGLSTQTPVSPFKRRVYFSETRRPIEEGDFCVSESCPAISGTLFPNQMTVFLFRIGLFRFRTRPVRFRSGPAPFQKPLFFFRNCFSVSDAFAL